MAVVGEGGDHVGDVVGVHERLDGVSGEQHQLARADRVEEEALAEVLVEPAGPEGRPSIMRELAERPEEVPAEFAARFNSGDSTALAQVYEDAAVLVPQPGTPVTGPGLHAANSRLQQLGVPISVRPRHVYRNGDLALLIVGWTIDGTDRPGRAVHVGGTATDVARRGPDGRWRYVIDNPFGTGSQRLAAGDTAEPAL
ncbi:YybH family protein [Streptomyces xinghaiensis]|uniref:YybH family protein n=1 Tax=Streptomyces xinghaiensis TaxID=1038928 RepID=UPI0037985B8D